MASEIPIAPALPAATTSAIAPTSPRPPGIAAPGYLLRITPERVGGVGPWADGG